MRSATFGLTACLAVGLSGTCLAQELKAERQFRETQIGFSVQGSYQNFTLSITGPNRFHATAASATTAPSIDLHRLGAFDDGTYNYQLTASTGERIPVRSRLDNGREGPRPETILGSISTSGQFEVKGGTIVKTDPTAREDVKRQQ